jgi:protein-tyrosine-phosphatase
MAEGFANNMPGGGIHAKSAGIGASPGKAMYEAVTAMKKNYNIDISSHRTTHTMDVKMEKYDYIFALDAAVFQWLRDEEMVSEEKLFQWDIQDPIGMSVWVYEEIAEKIRKRLENFLVNLEMSK